MLNPNQLIKGLLNSDPNSPPLNEEIVDVALSFNIDADPMGACYGGVLSASLVSLYQDTDELKTDLDIIAHLGTSKEEIEWYDKLLLIDTSGQDIEWYRELRLAGVTDKEIRDAKKNLIHAIARLSEIVALQDFRKYAHLVPENVQIREQFTNIDEFASFFSPGKVRNTRGDVIESKKVTVALEVFGYYSEKTLRTSLSELRAFSKTLEKNTPVSFIFCGPDHATSGSFDPMINRWAYFDSHEYPSAFKSFDDNDFEKFVICVLSGLYLGGFHPPKTRTFNTDVIINTQVLCLNECKNDITNTFNVWKKDQINLFKLTLEELPNFRNASRDITMIYLSVRANDFETASMLLTDLRIDKKNNSLIEEDTLLMATKLGNTDIVKLLVNYFDIPPTKINTSNPDDKNPFWLANKNGDKEIVRFFLEKLPKEIPEATTAPEIFSTNKASTADLKSDPNSREQSEQGINQKASSTTKKKL